MTKKRKLLSNQQGQGILEYIILTALIGIFCLAAVQKIGKSMNTRFNQINKKITEKIEI